MSFQLSILLLFALSSTGCAYRLGTANRKLPGDYSQVTVPLFKNKTFDTGLEVPFTNALIYELERAHTGKVVQPELAEVEILGEIRTITTLAESLNKSAPLGTVLASAYRMRVEVKLIVRKNADKSVLWEGVFNDESTYTAPAVAQGGLNTVNPLYNQTARRQNLESLASAMMAEAHDRITENF